MNDSDTAGAADILLEQVSPDDRIQAVVEQDGRVAYFYLYGAPESGFGMRTCWIRNLGAAPDSLDKQAMQAGVAPMLPRQYCLHPDGASALDASALSVVWFEEGDGAALLEHGSVVAIIPGWSGQGGFHGYAVDCTAESPLCWPLADDNVMHERVRRAGLSWSAWDREPTPWSTIEQAQLASYATQIGPREKYFNIGGDAWPPRGLLRIPVQGGVALVTVGLGLRPQPAVEQAMENPTGHRRIELGAALSAAFGEHADMFSRYLSGQCQLPWTKRTWLGPHHTVPCDALPGTGFTAVLLCRTFYGAPLLTLPAFGGDSVNLLWAIPITSAEREFAMANDGAALAGLLEKAGAGWLAGPRAAVV